MNISTIASEEPFQQQFLATTTGSSQLMWSPTGRYIIFNSDSGLDEENFHIMRADGAEKKKLTNPRQFAVVSASGWSPDEKQIIISAADYGRPLCGQIYTIFIEQARIQRLTDESTCGERTPRVSPR